MNNKFFKIVTRYFPFFKHVPLIAKGYEGMQLLMTLLMKPQLFEYMDKIEREISSWPGIYMTSHKYGGMQFNINKKEIGHIHGSGILDILFSRSIKQTLISREIALEHHSFKNSGWVSFYIQKSEDVTTALKLFEWGYYLKTNQWPLNLPEFIKEEDMLPITKFT